MSNLKYSNNLEKTSLKEEDFDFLCRLLEKKSGLMLDVSKTYLVEALLKPLVQKNKMSSLADLICEVRRSPSQDLIHEIIAALTNNETSFFRNWKTFEILKMTILPELLRKRAGVRELNIWCAACSSGQEAFSIAMLLAEDFSGYSNWKIRIIASDISRKMLDLARQGYFQEAEMERGLPENFLKYFTRQGRGWKIDDKILSMINFREINLNNPLPDLPVMDIIFMRNVLMYFCPVTKSSLIFNLKKILRKDGYLILGNTELLAEKNSPFQKILIDNSVFYQLQGGVNE